VCSAEGIINVNVSKGGQTLSEGFYLGLVSLDFLSLLVFVFSLLFGVETKIFK
jgi:hypothetical protein